MIIKRIVLPLLSAVFIASCFSMAWAQQGPGLSSAPGSQQGFNRKLADLYRTLGDRNIRNANFASYEGVDGSAYFEEGFQQGKVYYKGEFMGSPFLRYDAYADEIQIKKTQSPEEQYGALLKSEALSCVIATDRMAYMSLKTEKGEHLMGYVSPLIQSGEYLLYLRRSKLFQEGKVAATSLTASINSKFIDAVDYYFGTTKGGQLIEVPTKKRELVALFNEEDRDDIRSYIKKKRLRLTEKDDMITLFYFANTL